MSGHVCRHDATAHAPSKSFYILLGQNRFELVFEEIPALSKVEFLLHPVLAVRFKPRCLCVDMVPVVETVVLKIVAQSCDKRCHAVKGSQVSLHNQSIISCQRNVGHLSYIKSVHVIMV